MKFQPEHADGVNMISRHDPQAVWVGPVKHVGSIVVPWRGPALEWAGASLSTLDASHFAIVSRLEPEVVIFGSGARLRFVSPALLRPLIERGIGVETMDTAAACRTYNVLAAEGRSVVAALIVGS